MPQSLGKSASRVWTRSANIFVASAIITNACHFRTSFARFSGDTALSSMNVTYGTELPETRSGAFPGFHPGLGSAGPSGRGTCEGGAATRGVGPRRSQGFTLGWVPPALQAEAQGRGGPRCAVSVASAIRGVPGFYPGLRSVGPSGRDTGRGGPRCAGSGVSAVRGPRGFTLGCVPSALQAEAHARDGPRWAVSGASAVRGPQGFTPG